MKGSLLTAVSLYSGADNLGDGFIQAGGTIKVCVEQVEDCCKTIKLNHPDIEVICGTVADNLTTLPKVDCCIGGPPCPEFSPAKHNKTFDLCEVNNFRTAIEVTKARHHFMENVPLLYKVHKKRNHIVNCADYGVPQTRVRRIFTDLTLPHPTHAETAMQTLVGEPLKKWVSVREALDLGDGVIEDRETKYFGESDFRNYSVDKPNHTLLVNSRDWFIANSGHNTQNRELITRSIDEPADTVTIASTMELSNYQRWSRKKPRNRKPGQSGVKRALTNKELAIIQGFRTDFKFYGGKTSVKGQIGNALPAAISKAFFLKPIEASMV